MAQHLEILLLSGKTQEGAIEAIDQLTIDINELKAKPIKEWKADETEVVLNLLITQIKPYISVSSSIRSVRV